MMIDQTLLDRLIDGELTDAEQRDALSRIDAEPATWRRLALGFVEAQRWRKEFRAMAEEAGREDRGGLSALRPGRGKAAHSWSGQRVLASVCASVLVAFVSGFLLGAVGLFPQDADRQVVEKEAEPAESNAPAGQRIAERSELPPSPAAKSGGDEPQPGRA